MLMKNPIIPLLLTLCMLLFTTTACTNREQKTINRLEKLSKKLERKGNDMSIAQWQSSAKEFRQICDEINKSYQNFSPKQLHEIGRLKGICIGAFSRYVEHTAGKAANEADGYLQGIEEMCGKDAAASARDKMNQEADSADVDTVYI